MSSEFRTNLAKSCFQWILIKVREFLADNNERIVTELEIATKQVLSDASAFALSIVFKGLSILLIFAALKVALPSTAYHIHYVLTLLRKQKLARDALEAMADEAAVGDNVQNRCPQTGGCCLYGIHDSAYCCNRADKDNKVFWAHHMGYLFLLAVEDYTEWVWSAWKKKKTEVDKVEAEVDDVVAKVD